MRVYVVECTDDLMEDCYMVDIFDSLVKANEAIKEYEKQTEENGEYLQYTIIPWVVK